LEKPVLQNPETPQKNPHFEIFWAPLKIVGNRGKIQDTKSVHRGKNAKKMNLKPVARNFPTGKPSHLPLVSPHICLQINGINNKKGRGGQNEIKFPS
jgi:hypothetical protein